MPKVIIYTTKQCPYCVKAKNLFNQKQVAFEEIDVANDQARQQMTNRSGGKRTVPQIFINEEHIGGCDDLYILEQQGKLDELLMTEIINL